MSSNPLSVLYPATRGMDMRTDDVRFTPEQSGRFVKWTRNMRVHHGYWRTRFPFLQRPIEASASFHGSAWEGAILYHPHEGEGVHYQGVGKDRIIASYGGVLNEISLSDYSVRDISGNVTGTSGSRVPAYLEQAENYVIRTDGVSPTIIHNGDRTTFYSRGYNRTYPPASSVPNHSGAVRYLGNRLWTSAYGRRLYAGDSLHSLDPEEAIDLLRFREQSYDATSQWFAPASRQGDTVALSKMQVGNQDYIVMHGDNMGMTGVRLGVFPRIDWPNQQMTLTISNETAAAGPYSFSEGDWRLLFRSRRGIDETTMVLAEDNLVGGTTVKLGAQVEPLLSADMETLLIFSSLVNPPRWNRTLLTSSPEYRDGFATHRGILAMNRNPGDAIQATQWAWEGVWTLPERMGRVQQLIDGRIDSRQRVFALTRAALKNGLVEMREIDGPDMLADGTAIRQNGAFRTHRLSTDSEYLGADFEEYAFLLRDMLTDCDVEIYVRDSEKMDWRLQRDFRACLDQCGKCDKCCQPQSKTGEAMIPLGKLAQVSKDSRWVQFHVETWGVASWDFAVQNSVSSSLDQTAAREPIRAQKDCSEHKFSLYNYQER